MGRDVEDASASLEERNRLLTIVETQAQQVKQLTDQRPPQPDARRGFWRRLVREL